MFSFRKRKKQKINKEYVTDNAAHITEEDIGKAFKESSSIKSKLEANSRFDKFLVDTKIMLSLIKDYWRKDYTAIPWYAVSAIVFSLLYVLNPLDLAPDYIPFLGYMDDVTVLSFAVTLVRKDLTAYEDWKNGENIVSNKSESLEIIK